MALPELSRFELDCLRRIWARGEASARQVHADIPGAPSYSTVRKIIERLEEKGAVERARLEGRAWIYRSRVSSVAMIRKEVRRLVEMLFDGRSRELVSHLAETEEITIDDLRAAETILDGASTPDRDAPVKARPERRRR
jgi:BlaI family penicillinase repressor